MCESAANRGGHGLHGDDDALAALIEKYERLLKTIIYREIRNVEEEADIYSQTVHAIIRRFRRQMDDIESVKKWMMQVARSKCQDFLVKAKKRSLLRESAEAHYVYVAGEAEYRRLQQERLWAEMEEVRGVVKELGSIYVEVFELWAKGWTEAESAEKLEKSVNTIKSRRAKIRKEVRERLGGSRL